MSPITDKRDAGAWLKARAPLWRRFAEEASAASTRSRASSEEALHTMEAYRALARDLASARELLPGNVATAALERAYAAVHAAVGRPPRLGRARLLKLFREEIPVAAISVRPVALWIALLLAASALAGWWLISTYPELIGLIASERMIDAVEHGRLWTDQLLNVAPSSILSAQIFSNNVVVSSVAFCAGLFFGLGTFYVVAVNGLMLGGLFAFTHQHGLGLGLLKFTLAHGPVELSVICLAGAAGTALGESLIRPTCPTRAESFRRAVARVGPLLLACALLLCGSGLLEGFISPNPRFSIPVRLAIGLGYWLVMLLLLSGRWLARPSAPSSSVAQGLA
ncbi:MAG: stage II sporulation protein M [Steroidobacteraceae bacterium]